MAKAHRALPTMDAKGWRRLAETVAFHMGQLAHDLAMLERESEPAQCKPGRDGSLCGCDDEDEPAVPGVCMGRECDC